MLRLSTSAVLATLILLSWGCSEGDPAAAPDQATTAVVSDSAGITLRKTPGAALDRTAYLTDASPLLLLDGTAGGGKPFHAIGAVAFTPQGGFAIAERGEMGVRIHDADGRRLRVVGREGEGPGEFGALNGLGFRDDTLFVFDSRSFRISAFDPEGEFVRQIVPRGDWGSRPRWYAMSSEVGILTTAQRPGSELMWGLHDLAGEPIGALPDVPAHPTPTMTMLSPAGAGAGPREALSLFQPTPGAGLYRGRIAAFSGEGYRVQLFTPDGSLEEVWSVADAEPRRVTPEDIDRARDRAFERADDDLRPTLRQMWAEVETPDRFPSFGSGAGMVYISPPELLESPAGELWVRGFPSDTESVARWWVFAADGTLRGSVMFPSTFELQAVGDSTALGILEDEYEVQRVALYRLSAPLQPPE